MLVLLVSVGQYPVLFWVLVEFRCHLVASSLSDRDVLPYIFFLNKNKTYTVAMSQFLAYGGDGFTAIKKGQLQSVGPLDQDALISYIKQLPTPFEVAADGRIRQLSASVK